MANDGAETEANHEPRCPQCMHHSPRWVPSPDPNANGDYQCTLCGCVFSIAFYPPPPAAGWPPHECVTCGRKGRAFTALDTWIQCSDGERCAGCATRLIAGLRAELSKPSFWPTHVLVTIHVGGETKLSRTVCPVMLRPNGDAPTMSEYSWGSRASWTRPVDGEWLFQGKHPHEVVQLYSYERWRKSRELSDSWGVPMLQDAESGAEMRLATMGEQEAFERALLDRFGEVEGTTIQVSGRSCVVRLKEPQWRT